MGVVGELERAALQVAATAAPAVVGVGRCQVTGAGVVVAPGVVLTGVGDLSRGPLPLTFSDGTTRPGRVVDAVLGGEVAVVAVDTTGAAPVAWSAAAGLRVGMPVFALDPGGQRVRATAAMVSSVGPAFPGARLATIAGSVDGAQPPPAARPGVVVDAGGRLLGLTAASDRPGAGFSLAAPWGAALRAAVAAVAVPASLVHA